MRSKTPVKLYGVLVATITVLLGAGAQNAAAAEKSAAKGDAGFSFVAYGDSRPMMYLPMKDGKPELTKLFVEMFGLVMPEKIAEEVVKKDVKMIFDPATKELIQIIMPFMTTTEVMTLTVDKGWITEASVEDVKLLPGVHRTMFRLQGGEWVAREIVRTSSPGAPNSWSTAATLCGGAIKAARSTTARTGSA